MATPLDIVMSVYLGIVILLIVGGNSLVIASFIFGSRRMKTYTNYFIVNLAVADLLVGILSIPYWIYVKTILPPDELTRKLTEYRIFQTMDIMFGMVSIFNLVSLTLERLCAVAFPTWHFNMTWRPVATALSATWVVALFFSQLNWLTLKYISKKDNFYILFALGFLLPTIVIIACYVVIFNAAKKSEAITNRRVKKDVKIARMILVIIGLFLLCWMPFFALSMTYHNCSDWCAKIPTWLIQIVKSLHYSNSMMNFLVYAARSPDYRCSFSALIRWSVPRPRSDTTTSFNMNRKRTVSNPSNSNDNAKADDNGRMAGNDTLSTPLPERASQYKESPAESPFHPD